MQRSIIKPIVKRPFPLIKRILLIAIVLLIFPFIAFLILYFTVTQIRKSNRITTAAEIAAGVTNGVVPPRAQLIDVPSTVKRYDIPPEFVTVLRITPNVDGISLIVLPSTLYEKGSLIRIENNGTNKATIGPVNGVSVTGANGTNLDIPGGTQAALVATANNTFTMIKTDAVNRVNIRTQADVNAIQITYDPTGLTYRYFFEKVYYVRRGGNLVYSTNVDVNSFGGFSYKDELGNSVVTVGPPSIAIGDTKTAGSIGALAFPLFDIIRAISWATPADPINNFLNAIDKKLNEVRDNIRAEKPIQIRVRNPLYLYLAIGNGLILTILIIIYVYLRTRR